VRVAIVHHWFGTRGGGQRVAECIASLFPTAGIFTLVSDPVGIPEGLRDRKIHTSFLRAIPFAARYHRHLMRLYPEASASLDSSEFDLVISSDSGPVKASRVSHEATHICYCHSQMRYLYNSHETYRSQMSVLTRAAFTATASLVRRHYSAAAQRVIRFIMQFALCLRTNPLCLWTRVCSNSSSGRRGSRSHCRTPWEPYLCAGRLVGYKRADPMIEACRRLGRLLRIVGTGPELARLQEIAGSDVAFLGGLSTAPLRR
jgi:glycosyltransferase involved in cell wall biosynthesis